MKYLDFDLAIEPAGDGYLARVFNSPGGQASAQFSAPFSDLELENFLLRVGRTRHAVRRIESPEMTSAKLFGGRLFDVVFAGDVRACLRGSLDDADRQGAGLRIRLNLSKAPALADLPWEFLYNSGMNRFLSLSVETPLVRYLDLPERIRPVTVKPPLRVLMMISSPKDYPELDVARESEKMSEAFDELERRGLVVVERQENATLAELQRLLRRGEYHIFHFIGHGGFDEAAQDGLLILEGPEERGRRVSAQYLGTLLHDHRPLRLAVLNACEGARASRADAFAGTAQSLVQQGIPAVIAMQFEVTDEAAICFTREFYAAVAGGYPVDSALAEARKAIYAQVSELEWGTPVLYMRAPDGRIFDVEQVSDVDRRQLQVGSLLNAAREAEASGNEAGAIEKLNAVLAVDPAHADASARLRDLTSRRDGLAQQYAAGRAAYEEKNWAEAISALRQLPRSYRDVETLRAGAESALARAAGDADRHRRAADLHRAATSAMASGLWDVAVEKWQALTDLEPAGGDARQHLAEACRQQDFARRYARGHQFYARGAWRDAASEFRTLQQMAGGYKDVATLLVVAERELAKDHLGPGTAPGHVVLPPPPPVQPARRGSGMVVGIVLGMSAIVGIIAVVIAVTLGLRPEPDTPTPVQPFMPVDDAQVTPADVPQIARPVSPAPPPPAETAPPPAPAADPMPVTTTGQIEEELRALLERAGHLEIEAFRSLDPSPLQQVYTGGLLQTQLAAMEALRIAGVTMVNTLHNRQFQNIEVGADGQTAQVTLTERWSSNFHPAAGPQNMTTCVGHYHEHDVPQTAYLRREGGRWLIYSSIHANDESQMVPCHQ